MAKSKQRATYDDLLKLPDHLIGEIIDGELIATPRPVPAHMRIVGEILMALHGPFDRGIGGPGGWIFLIEPELHLHGNVAIPDIAGWRRERMPRIPTTPGVELAPDWVCEVLSPSTARYDRSVKMRLYERERVGHVWLVDPPHRTLEVFRLEGERLLPARVVGGDEKASVEPFEAVEIDLSRWWPE